MAPYVYIRRAKTLRILGIAALGCFILLVSLFAFPVVYKPDLAEATPGTPEVPTLAMVVGKQDSIVELTPINKNGTFASSDDTTAAINTTAGFGVKTNNWTGYNLVLNASSSDANSDKLINAATGDTLSSITTATSEADFKANTTAAASNYNGKWGLKPSMLNSAANTNYIAAPTTSSQILLNQTKCANGKTVVISGTSYTCPSIDNYTVALGARVDYTKPSGTYTNTYTVTATANPVAYTIEYYDVSGTFDSTTKKMGFTKVATQASAVNTATSVTLAPGVTRTRGTYTFAGWCRGTTQGTLSVNDMVTFQSSAYYNPGTLCNGTVPSGNANVYATGANMLIDPTVDNTNIKLYAVWTPTTFDQAYAAAGKNKNTTSGYNYYKMQDMTTAICNATSIHQIGTLVDLRPNAQSNTTTTMNVGTNYKVIKLMDGKCWMLDNLDLNLINSTVVAGITTANTHVNSTSLNALKNGGGSDANGRARLGLAYTNWVEPTDEVTQPWVNRSGTCKDSEYPCSSAYAGKSYTNTTVITTSKSGVGSYRVGTFYNYCAASAGSYCYSSTSTHTSSASYDICPYAWKLPLGNTSQGSFYYLNQAITTISTTPATASNPLSFQGMLSTPFAGTYHSGTAYVQGNNGFLWSSTYQSADSMYQLSFGSSFVTPQASNKRAFGRSVRCIAQ